MNEIISFDVYIDYTIYIYCKKIFYFYFCFCVNIQSVKYIAKTVSFYFSRCSMLPYTIIIQTFSNYKKLHVYMKNVKILITKKLWYVYVVKLM